MVFSRFLGAGSALLITAILFISFSAGPGAPMKSAQSLGQAVQGGMTVTNVLAGG